MSETIEEPPVKKMRTNEDIDSIIDKINNSENNLTPVIEERYYEKAPNVRCFVGTINNPKDISKTLVLLNDKLPLKDLEHLKRVRTKKVLLCLADDIVGNYIENYIDTTVPEIKDVFVNFEEIEVTSLPPKIKKQFDEANKIWPCNFHPNKYSEKLVSGNFFDDKELKMHKLYMAVAFHAAKFYVNNESYALKDVNVSVVADPAIDSIVAVAINNKDHPIQHAAMLAIDKVAATQNGGAWVESNREYVLRGVDEDLQSYLKRQIPNLNFGARKFVTKSEAKDSNESINNVPYLCTGYYIYTLKEPCLMCSMGLVHARIKKVFFCYNNESGALKSTVKLHTIKDLNHHFEVFTGFL